MAKLFFSSSYFDYVEKNLSEKFIGWPIMQELGGYSVTNILDKLDPERTQLRISKEDIHPNAEGHKIIAQEIYNAYEKVYI
jgi:lysophospholipase L1-like esterase